MKYSGIGGQAVIEGVMMKNKEDYAVAVRLESGEIKVEKKKYKGIGGSNINRIPLVRGVVNFIDSLYLGMSSLMVSASYFEDEEGRSRDEKTDEGERVFNGNTDLFACHSDSVIYAASVLGITDF